MGGWVYSKCECKNLFIGAKFWKSSKIIKALTEEDYKGLESRRKGGPSKQPLSSICIDSSSSDSDGIRPLKRQKRSSGDDISDKLVAIEDMLTTMKSSFDALRHVHRPNRLSALFSCIICRESSLKHEPLVPQCCSGVVACRQCLEGWFVQSSTCPHCRQCITVERCLPFPSFRPFTALIDGDAQN